MKGWLRRAFVAALCALGVAGPAAAQTPGKPPLVAYLTPGPPQNAYIKSFVEAMRALGYVEGKNVRYDFRGAMGEELRLGPLAREIAAARPDVVVAGGVIPVRELRRASMSIPIVASSTADPVLAGFAASLSRPGGNVTGIANMADELLGKQIEILAELRPNLRRIAVLLNPDNPVSGALIARAREIGASHGFSISAHEVSDKHGLAGTFGAIQRGRPDGLVVATDAMLYGLRQEIVAEVGRLRLAAVYPIGDEWVSAGGLASYGPSIHEIYRRAAYYVDRILKGANPSELPMEQPTRFELALNLKTARAISLAISRSILLRADRVIE